ncbi:HAD family hydrolase [Nocardioides sp. BP30]|uniref:HAD family hydrolase n=1 Tax=Nocardioides sp. BP30 TaxID=3036374 RepID=UPI0024695E47|nr:HAD family hydrolase [Nocardioides sp. BP30]WGL53031.1 HAD family hydrolase [Nocardioides sp. BP30]
MTSVSAALGSSSPTTPRLVARLALPRLGLTWLAVLASYALAIAVHTPGAIAAAALATLLLGAAALLVRQGAEVSGPRPVPRWYAAAAVGVAAVVLLARGSLDSWSAGAMAAVATLLALAPGAVLAASETPLRQAVVRGRADGIALRRTGALLGAREVDTVALDGLETVVSGKVVDQVHPLDESHLRNLRWFAGALAHSLDSPLGRAVAKLSAAGNLADVTHHPDLGISGSVDRHPTRIGRLEWLGLEPVTSPWDVVGVEVDGRPLGYVTVADALRAGAAERVAALRADGLDVLLVAVPAPRVEAVAEQVGIATVVTEAPRDAAVVSSRAVSARLLLGPAGQDIGVEQADIASAVTALELCRATDRTQRRSIRIALGWHGLAAVLAAAGLLAAWPAAAVAVVGTGVVWGISRVLR